MSFESSMLEFRFSEKSGPELVEFNVWGYFAAVVLQALGVLLITSTAAGTEAAGNGGGNGGERLPGASSARGDRAVVVDGGARPSRSARPPRPTRIFKTRSTRRRRISSPCSTSSIRIRSPGPPTSTTGS